MNKLFGKLCFSISTAVALSLVGAFGFSAGAQANDLKEWQTKIVKLVAKKQVYPRAAMRQELEGRAKVRVSIDRDGNITGHDIVAATGQPVFDEEIPKLIERINPLPAPPSDLSDDQLSFVLPLSWVIR